MKKFEFSSALPAEAYLLKSKSPTKVLDIEFAISTCFFPWINDLPGVQAPSGFCFIKLVVAGVLHSSFVLESLPKK